MDMEHQDELAHITNGVDRVEINSGDQSLSASQVVIVTNIHNHVFSDPRIKVRFNLFIYRIVLFYRLPVYFNTSTRRKQLCCHIILMLNIIVLE